MRKRKKRTSEKKRKKIALFSVVFDRRRGSEQVNSYLHRCGPCLWPLRHTADTSRPLHCTRCTRTCADRAAAWRQTWGPHTLRREARPLAGPLSDGPDPLRPWRRRPLTPHAGRLFPDSGSASGRRQDWKTHLLINSDFDSSGMEGSGRLWDTRKS